MVRTQDDVSPGAELRSVGHRRIPCQTGGLGFSQFVQARMLVRSEDRGSRPLQIPWNEKKCPHPGAAGRRILHGPTLALPAAATLHHLNTVRLYRPPGKKPSQSLRQAHDGSTRAASMRFQAVDSRFSASACIVQNAGSGGDADKASVGVEIHMDITTM